MSDRIQAPLDRRRVLVGARSVRGPYVVLACEDPDGPRPQAGQFYMLSAGGRWGGGDGERPFLPRALSVMRAAPGGRGLEFLIEDVGPGTARLCELQVGDGLLLLGPLGVGFAAPREGRRPLLVGGGVGIAPLVILRDRLGPGVPPPLLGFRDTARALASREWLPAARVATDDGGYGHRGLVTDLLAAELARDGHAEVYACGPPAMLEAVRLLCAEHRAPAQLALESGMACGYGACFGCVVRTREGYIRLCVDGPVVDADRLEAVVGVGAVG